MPEPAVRLREKDLLGRRALANALAEKPYNHAIGPHDVDPGPTVVTIEGPWGSGKSTLLLERTRHLVILAEIVTRWPALQRFLHRSHGDRTGLQLIAAVAQADAQWPGGCPRDTRWAGSLRRGPGDTA